MIHELIYIHLNVRLNGLAIVAFVYSAERPCVPVFTASFVQRDKKSLQLFEQTTLVIWCVLRKVRKVTKVQLVQLSKGYFNFKNSWAQLGV